MAGILAGIKSLAEALQYNLLGMASGLFGIRPGGFPAFGQEIRNRFSGLTDRVFLAISGYITAAQNAARQFTDSFAPATEDIPRNPNLPAGTAYQAAVVVQGLNPTPSNESDLYKYITINVPFSRRPRNNADVERALLQQLIDVGLGDASPGLGPSIAGTMISFKVNAIERRGR